MRACSHAASSDKRTSHALIFSIACSCKNEKESNISAGLHGIGAMHRPLGEFITLFFPLAGKPIGGGWEETGDLTPDLLHALIPGAGRSSNGMLDHPEFARSKVLGGTSRHTTVGLLRPSKTACLVAQLPVRPTPHPLCGLITDNPSHVHPPCVYGFLICF